MTVKTFGVTNPTKNMAVLDLMYADIKEEFGRNLVERIFGKVSENVIGITWMKVKHGGYWHTTTSVLGEGSFGYVLVIKEQDGIYTNAKRYIKNDKGNIEAIYDVSAVKKIMFPQDTSIIERYIDLVNSTIIQNSKRFEK